VHTKFEVDSSIHSKVIRGSQNFEIGSHDPGHAHLGVAFEPETLNLCRNSTIGILTAKFFASNWIHCSIIIIIIIIKCTDSSDVVTV